MQKEKQKILIIEDEKALMNVMRIKLESENYEVLTALGGEEGIKVIQEKMPDLVLLDIIMPEMDGFEVLEKLKVNEETKDIPVIVLSNSGREEEIEKGRKLGAVDYLIKAQLSLEEMVEKVKKYL